MLGKGTMTIRARSCIQTLTMFKIKHGMIIALRLGNIEFVATGDYGYDYVITSN